MPQFVLPFDPPNLPTFLDLAARATLYTAVSVQGGALGHMPRSPYRKVEVKTPILGSKTLT